MTYEKMMSDRLKKRMERVLKLIELGVPIELVRSDLSLVVSAAIGYGGPEVLSTVGETVHNDWLRSSGFCTMCNKDETPRRANKDSGLCEICETRESQDPEGS